MQIRNPNPLPDIHKEIKLQEKRMRTLGALEKILSTFSKELKQINITCPFGAESLGVQTAVNTAQVWANNYSKYLIEISNYSTWSHSLAMKVLAENDHILDPQEIVEDQVALIKTHLTQELEASRIVRQEDRKIQREFEDKLNQLEEDFKKANQTPLEKLNKQNDHYTITE